MIIQNDQMIFSDNEEVICICKGKAFAYGNVMKVGPKYVIKVKKEYIDLSSLHWDYVVPFEKQFKEYLDDHNIKEQYTLIKEQFHNIIENKGRKL